MWRSAARTLLAAAVALAALAGTAQAVHWPFFGGDNGRSGYQPVGEGTAPVNFLYSKTGATDQFIKTSILTTAGTPDAQRVVYGTANGNVHLQVLAGGAPVGPEAGVKIDDGAADPDVFGPRASDPEPASVSFAESSGASGLGQVFAVHNDDDQSPTGDIALAQIDESNGALVKDAPLAGTEGFSIRSSVVLTGPDAQGGRVLFFVAENGDDERLFRVPISGAGAAAAAFGAVTSTPDVDADPQASPTLVSLRDPAGQPKAYVAVGTTAPASNLRTFAVSDLAAGPASGDLGDDVQTASVPVQPNGMSPSPAPALYVAARAGGGTVAHRLVQNGNEQALATAASSPALAGTPAPALAVSQEAGTTGGRVIVTTGSNLYVLDAANLAQAGTLSDTALSPGTSGFSQTTAAASGGLGYVTSDEGQQLVFSLEDGDFAEGFEENAGNAPPRLDRSGMGQPSISRGLIQFGSQKGLFVYVNRCGNDVSGTAGDDTITGSVAGENVEALGGADTVRGVGGEDCLFGNAGNDALSGNAGDDRVSAGSGNDRVFGRAGDDAVSGNDGDDRVSANAGEDRVFGRQGDDGVSGNADDDTVKGGAGDDSVFGRGGDDAISGNSGADRVVGGAGADRMFGRSGGDRMNGGSGADVMRGLNDGDRLFGGAGEDRMSGNASDDRLRGGVGDDRVFGRTGDDGVSGNAGNDLVDGGTGRDRLFGRSGADRIDARDGQRDVVLCGSGFDRAAVDAIDVVRGCERTSRRPL